MSTRPLNATGWLVQVAALLEIIAIQVDAMDLGIFCDILSAVRPPPPRILLNSAVTFHFVALHHPIY